MRSRWYGLLGVFLALMLVAGPFSGMALADTENGDPHAGHDMSTMDQSEHNGHDMSNMDGMDQDMDGMSSPSTGGHESGHDAGNNAGHEAESHGTTEVDHESAGGHGGHGGTAQDPNTPPNWPVIYGFGAFNLLIILAAALLKGKSIEGVN